MQLLYLYVRVGVHNTGLTLETVFLKIEWSDIHMPLQNINVGYTHNRSRLTAQM